MRLVVFPFLLAACTGAPAGDSGDVPFGTDTGVPPEGPTGCAPLGDTLDTLDSEAERCLLVLAELHVLTLYPALIDVVEAETGPRLEFVSEEAHAGTYTATEEVTALWGLAGTLAIDWEVTLHGQVSDDLRTWAWRFHVGYTDLPLGDQRLGGAADWSVDENAAESFWYLHHWEGSLGADGEPAADIWWATEGPITTINVLDGELDGDGVYWENPDPHGP